MVSRRILSKQMNGKFLAINDFVSSGEVPLAFVIPVATIVNHFIVGAGPQIIEITWDGKSENIEEQKVLQTVDKSFGCGVNSAIVTPRGSLFIGKIWIVNLGSRLNFSTLGDNYDDFYSTLSIRLSRMTFIRLNFARRLNDKLCVIGHFVMRNHTRPTSQR